MTMKVSKRDITILLIALGAILAFCVFQFYFRGAMDEKKKLDEENKKLQERLDKFYGIDENTVIANMAKNAEDLQTRSEMYPSRYRYEDLIIYLNEWEILPYDEMYNFPKYSIEETMYDQNIGGVLDWNDTEKVPVEASYNFGRAKIDAEFGANSYKAFKDMINKIYLDEAPKTIQTVTAMMDATNGFILGGIAINFLNVQNGTNVYKPVTVTGVPTSVENIFGPTYTPTPTPTPTPRPNQRLYNE
ncbi:MAG: hypothetical protein J5643_06580 [Lachnospiraceae bacterium]|nr:hypothetical protein [Lachnospiraceae bacterium]